MDIENYLERITELQEAAIAESNAVPVAVYSQSNYPYWTNHLSAVNPTISSYDFTEYAVTVVSTLYRGKVLSGERTQLERQCQLDTIAVLQALTAPNARNLITTYHTAVQDGYRPYSLTVTSQGVVIVSNGDITDMGSQYQLQFSHIDRRV